MSFSMFQSKTMSVFVFCICTLMLGFGLWVGWLGQRRRPEALKKSRKNWSSALLCSFAASLAHPRHTFVHMPVFIRALCVLLLNCTWYAKHGYSNSSAHFLFIYFWQIRQTHDHPSNLTGAQFAMALGSKRVQNQICICVFHNWTVLIFYLTIHVYYLIQWTSLLYTSLLVLHCLRLLIIGG